MQPFVLKCFGTGDGWPCADRNHAAFLYRFGKTSILIDCGEPISGSYKASGLGYDVIDAIFLSHLHSDHAGGFFMLMQGFWLEGRRKDLPVYLPAYAVSPMRRMLRTFLIFSENLKFRLRLVPLSASRTIRVGDARVTPHLTSHLDAIRSKQEPRLMGTGRRVDEFAAPAAYCFLLESGGRRIGHSADLGKPEDLEPLLQKPLDVLVCELAHFSPEQIFGYLKSRSIKRVIFVHLAGAYWEDLARTRRLAKKMLRNLPHSFARDFQEISF